MSAAHVCPWSRYTLIRRVYDSTTDPITLMESMCVPRSDLSCCFQWVVLLLSMRQVDIHGHTMYGYDTGILYIEANSSVKWCREELRAVCFLRECEYELCESCVSIVCDIIFESSRRGQSTCLGWLVGIRVALWSSGMILA